MGRDQIANIFVGTLNNDSVLAQYWIIPFRKIRQVTKNMPLQPGDI